MDSVRSCNSAGPDSEIESRTPPSTIRVVHTVRLARCTAHECKRASPRRLIAVSASKDEGYIRVLLSVYVPKKTYIKQNRALADTVMLCSLRSSPRPDPACIHIILWLVYAAGGPHRFLDFSRSIFVSRVYIVNRNIAYNSFEIETWTEVGNTLLHCVFRSFYNIFSAERVRTFICGWRFINDCMYVIIKRAIQNTINKI